VLARAAVVAPTRTPVLVTGESGTGKELLARALHELGPNPKGPFVAVNCGALSRELAESELFGHERGAFTGAADRRTGWFEEAADGTLVLDEIGELPLDLQPKLLRILETGRLRRVGGTGERPVSVRIVAMTHRDLRRDVRNGGASFRLDLFHRLAGFELALPPLRRRLGDVPALARHFLGEIESEVGTRYIDPAALDRLSAHDWPGNVRELRNVIRQAAILTGSIISAASLELEQRTFESPGPLHLVQHAAEGGHGASFSTSSSYSSPSPFPPLPYWQPPGDTISIAGKTFTDILKEIFAVALHRHGGSRRRAAQSLGISRSTFCDRVKRLGVA
jgi:two-component system nitrogen regulation response regulator GlnG